MNLRTRMAVLVAAVLVLAVALFAASTEGAGPYNVDGMVTKLTIHYAGSCGTGGLPLTLGTAIGGPGTALPPYVAISGSVRYCLATQPAPGALLIDGELFGYANVAAMTSVPVTSAYTGPVTVQNIEQQPDFPTNFQGVTQVFIGDELVNVTNVTSIGFTITARAQPGGATPATAHLTESLVRAQGRLKLLTRGQAKYAGGGAEALTPEASHSLSAAVASPERYLTCRARMDQTTQPGNDPVTSRTRCYGMLQPGTFWPDPYTGPMLALNSDPDHLDASLYHDILLGNINDTATGGSVPLTVGTDCTIYIPDLLWVKVTLTTVVSKGSSLTGTGLFRVSIYTDSACTVLLTTLGTGSNLTSTQVSSSTDTDGDGCSDYKELSSTSDRGGLRDPFNRWDFYDTNGDKVIDLFSDIFGVAFLFGADADNIPPGEPDGYVASIDRGPKLGPGDWNISSPDGIIDLFTDIFGVAFQFGHDCT